MSETPLDVCLTLVLKDEEKYIVKREIIIRIIILKAGISYNTHTQDHVCIRKGIRHMKCYIYIYGSFSNYW